MRNPSPVIVMILALAGAGLCLTALPASAGPTRDSAYADLLADPGNVEKNLTYARILVAENDLEGAIAVLERIALLYPQQPKIELELAIAYYRLGSFTRAAHGFARVIADPNADRQQIARAQQFQERLGILLSPYRLSGSLFAGFKLESNANAGTRNDDILVFGAEIDRPDRGGPDDDMTFLAGGRIDFAIDLDQQNGLAIEGNAGLQGEKHLDVDVLDRIRADGAIGLGFAPFDEIGNRLRLRPYLDFALEMRDGEFFSGAGGPGLALTASPSSDWRLGAAYEFWLRDFQRVETLGDTQLYSGNEHRLRLNATWSLRPGSALSASLGYRRLDARESYLDYDAASLALGFSQDYSSPIGPIGDSGKPWRVSLSVVHETRWYDAGDPQIDADIAREDHVWRIGLTNMIPLGDDWSLAQQLALTHTDSNLPNFEFDNVEFSMTAAWAF